MSALTPHKHADILRAIADGKTIQGRKPHCPIKIWRAFADLREEGLFSILAGDEIAHWELRVKPDPKPRFDVVQTIHRYFSECGDDCPLNEADACEIARLLAAIVPEVLEQEGGAA